MTKRWIAADHTSAERAGLNLIEKSKRYHLTGPLTLELGDEPMIDLDFDEYDNACHHPLPRHRRLETVDENLLLTFWFINQKGSLIESNVELEVKTNSQELQNEVLYVSVSQIS